jgi:hypothetical protein
MTSGVFSEGRGKVVLSEVKNLLCPKPLAADQGDGCDDGGTIPRMRI